MQLYASMFQTVWWIQAWYSFQTFVAMGMGLSGLFFPDSPAITLGGTWTDSKGKKMIAPNVRGWGVRNAIPALVDILAMYFGTREAYIIMCACACWREVFDIVDAAIENDMKKVWWFSHIPPGKFPPLGFFPPFLFLLIGDAATLYYTLVF